MSTTTQAQLQAREQEKSVSLFFRDSRSDKVYHLSIERHSSSRGFYLVNFAYGRRGSTLNVGTKTTQPVGWMEANRLYDKVLNEKLGKGYKRAGETQAPYQRTGDEGADTGFRCQLLNAVEEEYARGLLTDDGYCMQMKHDGRRLSVRKFGDDIVGINRRGLVVAIPDTIRQAVAQIEHDVLIDGEAIGDVLWAFDLLESGGRSLMDRGYLERHAALLSALVIERPYLRTVDAFQGTEAKVRVFDGLREAGAEGVVFKKIDAPYSAGKPNSGGSQFKFKFVETASFVVVSLNNQRSVRLGLYDGAEGPISVGNVTILPNFEVPPVGSIVETRYLNYMPGGSLYQPVYLGPRDDIPAYECQMDQLKIKVVDVFLED